MYLYGNFETALIGTNCWSAGATSQKLCLDAVALLVVGVDDSPNSAANRSARVVILKCRQVLGGKRMGKARVVEIACRRKLAR